MGKPSKSMWMLLLYLLVTASTLLGQTPNREVSIENWSLAEEKRESRTGLRGIEISMDINFNWVPEEYGYQIFEAQYRLEQDGKVVHRSAENGTAKPLSVMANDWPKQSTVGISCRHYTLFIPYSAISAENGFVKAEFIMTLSNKEGTYTDCIKRTIGFEQRNRQVHNLNEQVFDFQMATLDYAANENEHPGFAIKGNINYKFGPDDVMEPHYECNWLLRDSTGKVVFDARKDGSFPKPVKLTVSTVDAKPAGSYRFFVPYQDLVLEGKHKLSLEVTLLGAEGGPKQIHKEVLMVDLPIQYNFEAQEFSPGNVEVIATELDGVSGIEMSYTCTFKKVGLMRNAEKGNYYFYMALFDANGKMIVAPERAATKGARTSHLQDGHLPSSPQEATVSGKLFIPYYMLKLIPGKHTLKYALMVSDINLETKFPVLEQGTIAIQKPLEVRYHLSLEELVMNDSDYDVEFITYNSHYPELQYYFAVGFDNFYESQYVKNSLTAVPGSANLLLSQGDPINLSLYDVDSGFFNYSDMLGRWRIEYAGKTSPFYLRIDNVGQVQSLRLKVTKL
jgi:hypothetical protein